MYIYIWEFKNEDYSTVVSSLKDVIHPCNKKCGSSHVTLECNKIGTVGL